MISLEKIKTENSRLLYHQMKGIPEEWQQGLVTVESLVSSHPRLSFANSRVQIYFFSHGEKITSETPYWVGREVVGFPGDLEDPLGVYDLRSGFCYQFACQGDLSPLEELFWERIVEWETIVRRDNGGIFADTWRLSLDSERGYLQMFKNH